MPEDGRLTSQDYWRNVWRGVRLPVRARPGQDLESIFSRFLPADVGASFLEVGCAPGGWMSYFATRFKYAVSGIEYVDEAAAATERNLAMQGIAGTVHNADFLALRQLSRYDIVFSAGLIEHFTDPGEVVRRLAQASCGVVVTIVPNLHGLNGWISKTIRPDVFAVHNPLDRERLRRIHEECGLRTLFADYCNGIRLIRVADKRPFFEAHPGISRTINAPVLAFNALCAATSRATGVYPRTRTLSESLVYIGRL